MNNARANNFRVRAWFVGTLSYGNVKLVERPDEQPETAAA